MILHEPGDAPSPASSGASESLLLGTRTGTGYRLFNGGKHTLLPPSKVVYARPAFDAHQGRPWLQAFLRQHENLRLLEGELAPTAGQPFAVPAALLARHTVVVGGSGSGKTRLALHLLRAQLQAGCSALVMDVKDTTLRQALAVAEEAGLAPTQVTILWPQNDQTGVPGWNPFAVEARDVQAAVRRFVGLLSTLYKDGWGPRMDDIFKAGATVIAGQRLSILELVEFLRTPAYRDALLRQAQRTPAWERFREEHAYFTREFALFTEPNQQNQAQPVLNKIRGMITQPYLRALLTARDDTLDLPGLWQRQRLILVHLDQHELGPDGASLLSGLLAHQLLATAMQHGSPADAGQAAKRPVVLMLDEMGMQERFLGEAVTDILAVARSQGLRLLAAAQHLDQMSEGLKAGLLTNTALRVFFRLGDLDAPRVARSLALGMGSRPGRVSIEAPDAKAFEQTAQALYDLVDPADRPLSASPDAWTRLMGVQAQTQLSERADTRLLEALHTEMDAALVARVYVRAGREERTEIGAFARGLPGMAYSLTGPDPLRLRLAFPYPRVRVVETQSEAQHVSSIAGALREMPRQEALVATDTGQKTHIRIVDVTFPARLPGVDYYLRGQEQSADAIRQTNASRWAQIVALAAAPVSPANGEPDGDPGAMPTRKETFAAPEKPDAAGGGRRPPDPPAGSTSAPHAANTSAPSRKGGSEDKPPPAPRAKAAEPRAAETSARVRPKPVARRTPPVPAARPGAASPVAPAPAQKVADDGSL